MKLTYLFINGPLAWTTHRIQTTIEQNPALAIPDMLARISPARTAHINFRGTFQFPVEAYGDRLFSGACTGAGSGTVGNA